jgi:hypothetical protein
MSEQQPHLVLLQEGDQHVQPSRGQLHWVALGHGCLRCAVGVDLLWDRYALQILQLLCIVCNLSEFVKWNMGSERQQHSGVIQANANACTPVCHEGVSCLMVWVRCKRASKGIY